MKALSEKIKHIGKIVLSVLAIFIIAIIVVQFFSFGRDMDSFNSSSRGFSSPNTAMEDSTGLGYAASMGLGSSDSSDSSDYGVVVNEKSSYSQASDSSSVSEGDLTERKVVKNGSLDIVVDDADKTSDAVKALAETYSGFVSYCRVYETSDSVKYGVVTIRIPADSFKKALDDIKVLANEVTNEQIDASDVTEQYVDLEAQLKNLRAEEQQYLEVMKSAVTITDILEVSDRLSTVQGEIERIQGQLQYLDNQVDMSTLTVSITSEADVEVFGIKWEPLYKVKLAIRDMLSGLTDYADAMLSFIFQVPVYILWIVTIGLIVTVCWKILKWFVKRFILSHTSKKETVKKRGKSNIIK